MLSSILGAIGSIGSSILGAKSADKQAKLQKQYAQNAIQWKVEDAKKAGIHPLYALGAQTTSYQPVSTGDLNLGEAGQHIGRALDAGLSGAGRVSTIDKAIQSTQLDGLKLDNNLKRAQIAATVSTIRQAGHPPPLPSVGSKSLLDGQGDTPTISGPELDIKTNQDVTDPLSRGTVYGTSPEVRMYASPSGGRIPQMPSELAESLEGADPLGMTGLQWFFRNKLLPSFDVNSIPDSEWMVLPPGYVPAYNWGTGEYGTPENMGRAGDVRKRHQLFRRILERYRR